MIAKPFALLLIAGCVIAAAPPKLSPAERIAIFKAAGAVQRGGKWLMCAEQPNPGGATIDTIRDLNGDGRPEVVISEGGSFCYGAAEMGYALLSKQANGGWKVIDVYLNGKVSELALRRSEYASALKRDGFEQLLASVETKIAALKSKGGSDG